MAERKIDALPGTKQFEIVKFLAIDYASKLIYENEQLKKELRRVKRLKSEINCEKCERFLQCDSCGNSFCPRCQLGTTFVDYNEFRDYDDNPVDFFDSEELIILCNQCWIRDRIEK